MKKIYVVLLAFVALILQTTIITSMTMFGVSPNIFIIIMLMLILLFDEGEGMTFAVVGGLLSDLFLSKALGIHLLLYGSLALIVMSMKETLYRDNIFMPIILTFFVTLGHHSFFYILSYFFLDHTRTLGLAFEMALYASLMNVIVMYLVYPRIFSRIRGYKLT